MAASISDEDSPFRRKIEKVNPHIASLEMPFKQAVLTIRTSKCPFIAIHA
jgi:hypothetical protein